MSQEIIAFDISEIAEEASQASGNSEACFTQVYSKGIAEYIEKNDFSKSELRLVESLAEHHGFGLYPVSDEVVNDSTLKRIAEETIYWFDSPAVPVSCF